MSAEDTIVEKERPVSFDEVGRLLAASLLHVETQSSDESAYTHVFRAGTRTVPGVGFEYNLNVDGLIAGVLRIAGPRAAAELMRDIIVAYLEANFPPEEEEAP